MNNYIDENYTVVWHHPESIESDWKIFLLAETHNDKTVRAVNSLFISLFAEPGSFLLAESNRYLQPSRVPKYILRNDSIETPNITCKRILGWDSSDFYLEEPLLLAYKVALDIFKEIHNDLSLLIKVKWEVSLKKSIGVVLDIYEGELDNGPLIYKAIRKVSKEMLRFINNKVIPLATEYKLSCEKYLKREKKFTSFVANLSKESPPEDVAKCHFYEIRYENSLAKLKEAKETLKDCIENKLIDLYEKDKGVRDFPERTQSMITTLDHVSKVIGSKSTVFLIAGINHLEENPSMPEERRKLCSLDPLHLFLAKHKNIVILKPKCLRKTAL